MRLECALWFHGANGKAISRKSQGILALGRHENGKMRREFLSVTTRQNNHPTIIELSKVKTIWRKLTLEGKATIEFNEPRLTLYIAEAKPAALQSFLFHINNSKNGNSPQKQEEKSPQKQQPTTSLLSAIGNRPTKMRIRTSATYPKQGSGGGFPSTLQLLQLDNIGLCSVDLRWFTLNSLTYLSLSNNKLGKNWNKTSWRRFCAISRLQSLAELDLSNNPLGFLPDAFINSLPPSLKVLMLANCRLDRLSNRISRLQNLQVLSISNNPMEEIPEDLSLLPLLRKFYLCQMPKLRFLPATLFHNSCNFNRFAELDVSHNNHSPFASLMPPDQWPQKEDGGQMMLLTLKAIAAAAVLNNPQNLKPDGSHLLLRAVFDCLPYQIRQQMRQWLLRCAQCQSLYPPYPAARTNENFYRIQLRSFVSSTLIGPSPAYIRLQLCPACLRRPPMAPSTSARANNAAARHQQRIVPFFPL